MLMTEFLPAETKSSRRLLIALHGLGDSIAGYRWLPGELRLPWLNYLLVNAPDPYYGGFSWYDFAGDQSQGVQRSRAELIQLLDAKRAEGFPTEETVLFGFSQGCVMTVDVGFRYPFRFAGLIGISGYAHDLAGLRKELSPVASQQRMLFTHGTHDPMVPCNAAHEQVRQLQAAGLSIEWREFAKEHTIAGEAELCVIRQFITSRFAP